MKTLLECDFGHLAGTARRSPDETEIVLCGGEFERRVKLGEEYQPQPACRRHRQDVFSVIESYWLG